MSMKTSEKIFELRKEGKSYSEIAEVLKISKATVSYHCKLLNLNAPITNNIAIDDETIKKINEYYLTHTILETAAKFNVGASTVVKYTDCKFIKLNDDERRERNYNRVRNRRQKLKELGVAYLGGKCNKCGYDKCIWALEFHHKDPNEKDFTVSAYSNLAWDKIKLELDKCELVCSNCHKEIHYNLHWSLSPLSDKQLKG